MPYNLAFGGVTCPAWRELRAAEECISWNHPGTDCPLKAAWVSVKQHLKEMEHLIVEASVLLPHPREMCARPREEAV